MADVMVVPTFDDDVAALEFEARFDDPDDGDEWEDEIDSDWEEEEDDEWEEEEDDWEEDEDDDWEEDDSDWEDD